MTESHIPLDFEPSTLPWVDQDEFQDRLAARLASGRLRPELAEALTHWHRDGYVIFRGAIQELVIDAVLSDYERLWKERPPCRVQVGDRYGILLSALPARSEISAPFKILDLHNLSIAARKIILAPIIVEFMSAIYEEQVVAMQSLFFEFGSEQPPHQDFVFVPADIPSHLAACWIALEPIGERQGPLSFYPGSHRIDKFDFGGGSLLVKSNPGLYQEYQRHLSSEIGRLNLEEKFFRAEKGDILFWHGALVHGGSPILSKGRTRLSIVAHYSDIRAFPYDYRRPGVPPIPVQEGRGICYQWIQPGHIEGRYALT